MPYSFPGGMHDEGDRDFIHTALRETYEEIGLPEQQVDIWGTVPPSPSKVKTINCKTYYFLLVSKTSDYNCLWIQIVEVSSFIQSSEKTTAKMVFMFESFISVLYVTFYPAIKLP